MEALEHARESKNLLITARVLAELSTLKLAKGDVAAAQTAINEALDIDVRNGYDSIALHKVYQAQN